MDYKKLPLDLTAASVPPSKQPGTWPLDTGMWTWDQADKSAPYTPQGITSFIDGATGRQLIVVSWHANGTGDARISYLTKSDDGSDDYAYGHARLGDAGTTTKLHAGGIAFFDGQLLVADTDRGVVAFNVTNPEKDSQGIWQVARLTCYKLDAGKPALNRFSFADVDWTDPKAPLLLTGLYVDAELSAKYEPGVLGWSVVAGKGPDPNGPKVFLDSTPSSESFKSFWYMQGAAHYGGTWYLSQSGAVHQIRSVDGDLSTEPPVFRSIVNSELGLEDLHIPKGGAHLWGLTENVKSGEQEYPRLVFRIPLAATA